MGDSSVSVPGESMLKDADFDASTRGIYCNYNSNPFTISRLNGFSMAIVKDHI